MDSGKPTSAERAAGGGIVFVVVIALIMVLGSLFPGSAHQYWVGMAAQTLLAAVFVGAAFPRPLIEAVKKLGLVVRGWRKP